jgi:aminomethyltransferase
MYFNVDDPNSEDPKPTPLYRAVATESEANSWTSINGRAAARAYSSVVDEYHAAREAAAIVDVGPLRRITVRGPDARALLARLTSTPIAELREGESARGLMLNDAGRVVDYADVTRLSGEVFLLTSAGPLNRRAQLAIRGFDAAVDDVSDHVAALAIIGPNARELASSVGLDPASDDMVRQGRVRGVEIAARAIHLGAVPGVEVIFPEEEALTLFDRVRRASRAPLAGLDALDILRIEGGAPRLGVDFVGADINGGRTGRTPEEIGLPHLAPSSRGWFSGRRDMSAAAVERRVIAIGVDADSIAPGAAVFAGSQAAGRITSAAFSPHSRRVVAFADVAAAAASKPLEVATVGSESRVGAALLQTAERTAAEAYRARMAPATENSGWRVV